MRGEGGGGVNANLEKVYILNFFLGPYPEEFINSSTTIKSLAQENVGLHGVM